MYRLCAGALPVAFALTLLVQARPPVEPDPRSVPATKGPALQAGFAEADITPAVTADKPVYLAGFGHNRKATAVHDPLRAMAVVLADGKKKIALVCVDLVGFFHPGVVRVRKQLPGFDYVLVSSTHNHEGPDSLGLWGASPLQSGLDADYMAKVEKQIVQVVLDADKARKPVEVRIGSVKAPELLHDSREPFVKHDELVALAFRDPKTEKEVGLVVQWNCHPETLGSKNTQLSSDFVGPTVTTLKKRHGCPVVYLTGTVGGLLSSLKVPVQSKDGKPLEDGTFAKAQRYGELVADAADRALKGGKPVTLAPLEARSRTLYLPVSNKYYLVAHQLGVLQREVFLWEGDVDKGAAVKEVDPRKPHSIRTEVGYLRLGEVEVAVIPGEIYPELVLSKVQDPPDRGADFPDAPVEPGIYAQLGAKHRMLIGLANDEVGYIIPKRQWDEKPPFCYGRTRPQYGEINSLGPDTAPLLCKAFAELAKGKK